MKRLLTASLLTVCLVAALLGAQSGSATPPLAHPKGFFGIGPQTGVTPTDLRYMKAGGIESVRVPVSWAAIQPSASGGYDWSSVDPTVAEAVVHEPGEGGDHIVSEVMRAGYTWQGRVLRPAMVKVTD